MNITDLATLRIGAGVPGMCALSLQWTGARYQSAA